MFSLSRFTRMQDTIAVQTAPGEQNVSGMLELTNTGRVENLHAPARVGCFTPFSEP